MAKYQFIPEFFGLIFIISLFSLICLGVSSEELIVHASTSYINFNILALFFLVAPIFCDVFMYDFYDINYRYFKLLYPFRTFKIVLIDILLEMLSYKLIFVFFFLAFYLPFCLIYNLAIYNTKTTLGFSVLVLMYTNACLIIRLIKELGKNKIFGAYKNYLKLLFIILALLLTVNHNTNTISLYDFKTTSMLFFISSFSIVVIMILLYSVNSRYDKI